jgi:hypothetical protein
MNYVYENCHKQTHHNGSLEARNLHYSIDRSTHGSSERKASDYLRLVRN